MASSTAVDSINEFRVLTSNYSAEYGASAGAITVVQTKSGSNTLHGSAYEFLRNDKLDANSFVNNGAGAPKPAFRRNEFGGPHPTPDSAGSTFRRILRPPVSLPFDYALRAAECTYANNSTVTFAAS